MSISPEWVQTRPESTGLFLCPRKTDMTRLRFSATLKALTKAVPKTGIPGLFSCPDESQVSI